MPESHEDRAAMEAAWDALTRRFMVEWPTDQQAFGAGWQARGAYERERRDREIDLLRRLLHREHFFEAGRLGFKPPLYGESCPPCNGVDEELAALASVPVATAEPSS